MQRRRSRYEVSFFVFLSHSFARLISNARAHDFNGILTAAAAWPLSRYLTFTCRSEIINSTADNVCIRAIIEFLGALARERTSGDFASRAGDTRVQWVKCPDRTKRGEYFFIPMGGPVEGARPHRSARGAPLLPPPPKSPIFRTR